MSTEPEALASTEPQAPEGTAPMVLPEPVRSRIVALAAERLGEMAEADVPPSLRRIYRFTPSKRARLAGVALAAAVDTDSMFRNAVADGVRAALRDLVSALESGTPTPAADPYDLAAVAYLLRTPGWQDVVAAAAEANRSAPAAAATETADRSRQTRRLDEAVATARAERDKYGAEAAAATTRLDEVRRSLRQATDAQRRAEAALAAAESERDALRAASEKTVAKTSAELRRLKTRVAELEAQVDQVRRVGRDARSHDDVRLWLLLESVVNAAAGLRRELALPPATSRPADEVAAALQSTDQAMPAALGLAREDPAWLDALLAIPGTHLLVDGYNVTKTGFPGVSLEQQRGRLVQGLAALAARTAAEVTVVFDGAERTAATAVPSGRGVRVVFSPAGVTADDVLARLVSAEPAGRPIAVVTADREVVKRVERSGARGVPPPALLRLLSRK